MKKVNPNDVKVKSSSPTKFEKNCEVKKTIFVKSVLVVLDNKNSKTDKPIEKIVVPKNHHNYYGEIVPSTSITCPESTPSFKICPKCGESVDIKMMEHYKISKACCPKNFKCEQCNICFRSNRHLSNHSAVYHEHEKPAEFLCHMCPKMFKIKEYLNRHIADHNVGKKFACTACEKGKIFLKNKQLITCQV